MNRYGKIRGDAPSLRQPVEDSVPSILRRAADLIEPDGAWTRKELARDRDGVCVSPSSPAAVCWCMMGAVARVAPGGFSCPAYDDCTCAISRQVRTSITAFNDYDHTQAEVVAALRAAADQAERAQ